MKIKFFLPFAILIFVSSSLFSQDVRNQCAQTKQRVQHQKSLASERAASLQNLYDVKFHHLNLNVERNSIFISGNVRTLAKIISSVLDTFAFELHPNHAIDSIIVNGVSQPFIRVASDVFVALPQLQQNDMIDATIFYSGTAPSGASAAIGNGFSTAASPSWGNEATWSLSQPYAAYEWWPCKQQLTDKIDSTWCFITTNAENKAGSQGILTSITDLPNNKKRFEWKSNYPVAYYLISVAVAKYVDYNFYAHPVGSDSVLIQNYIYDNPQTLVNFKPIIDQTDEMMEAFAERFGAYPFANEKYGHCMAPFSGGMEHQTMTSQGFFNFTITAHELAHQWFGDNVTCKTWNDIFLNEGFASYGEYLALEAIQGLSAANAEMSNVHSSIMSSAGGSVFNPDTVSVSRIFSSRLSYDKGSAVLHTLRYLTGDSLFFQLCKNYQLLYKDNNASIADFKAIAESTSQMNLDEYFAQWIYGEGFPTYNIEWNQSGNTIIINSQQTVSMSSVTPLFTTPVKLRLVRAIGDTVVYLNHQQAAVSMVFGLSGNVSSIVIDPENVIVNGGAAVRNTNLLSSLEEHNKGFQIACFPNVLKSNETLYFTVPFSSTFSVYDVSAKLVHSGVANNTNAISLPLLSEGSYLIRLNELNKNIKFNIVK